MDSSAEGHLPISAHTAEHTAEIPVVKNEQPQQSEPLHMEERSAPQQETPQMQDTAADEATQRKLIEEMLRAGADQAVAAENPQPREIPMEMPVVPPPEPESILHAPPQKKSFIVGMLTQMKDGVVHLFDGLKRLLFSKKVDKPPKPTTFKNIPKPDAPTISFKQQPAGA